MTLEAFEPDQAEVVALLQPFVDGELSDDEHELVARQIADNPDYQLIVREQQQVRAALRGLERELASPELRARILADLDAVEAERRAAEQRGWLAPVVGRIRAFGRGAALMVPAAAAAVGLFVVASNSGWIDGPAVSGTHLDGGLATSVKIERKSADEAPASAPAPAPVARQVEASLAPRAEADPSLPAPDELGDNLGFDVQIAPPRALPRDVALVSDSAHVPGSSATVRYRDAKGAVIVDLQRRAGYASLLGEPHRYADHEFHLSRDERGRPQVEFELGRVHHSLAREGGDARVGAPVSVDEPDFRGLLDVAQALRRAHAR